MSSFEEKIKAEFIAFKKDVFGYSKAEGAFSPALDSLQQRVLKAYTEVDGERKQKLQKMLDVFDYNLNMIPAQEIIYIPHDSKVETIGLIKRSDVRKQFDELREVLREQYPQ